MRYCLSLTLLSCSALWAQEPDAIVKLWPEKPPGSERELGEERDFTKDGDPLIAGRRIIKLGNVSTPQIHVFRPEASESNGTSVVIAPGGGFSILAWDLEGTEVAQWLNTLGVTGIVLKYRVPTRDQNPRWRAPVQDMQRAVRLTRSHAETWGLDPDRIGVLGFSAGGKTAAMASLLTKATYDAVDSADEQPLTPNFSALINAGGIAADDYATLLDEVVVTKETPPVFFAHAFDDRVRIEHSLLLAMELKKKGVPCELHIYSEGGHGYGLRTTEQPVTTWHHRCADWMRINGWLDDPGPKADR